MTIAPAPTAPASASVRDTIPAVPAGSWWLRWLLIPVDRILHVVGPRYGAFFWVIRHLPPPLLALVGKWRAERAVDHALRRVPGYREYVARYPAAEAGVGRRRVPETDKQHYVQAVPLDSRCLDGRLDAVRVGIDESSGSTGTPFNWVRSADERAATHVFISHFARYCFGEGFVTLNAFSMGAWATGVNMGAAMERSSVVKNTGPDPDKVFRTLEFLGKERRYLICGYPPFLKHLIDAAAERGFPLGDYRLMGLVGGEGMSEGLRDYLTPIFDPVFSGYGATDIEIGLAGETPLSVAVRRLARTRPAVQQALFGDDPRLPMIFQYNPLQHHVTVNDRGELLFTISRLEVLAPRIAYNVHDAGGVASLEEIARRLESCGVDLHDLADDVVPLPFMWVYGRSDSTVSVMGANVYPEDLERALYEAPGLAGITRSFCLGSHEEDDGTVRPLFAFEVTVEPDEALTGRFAEEMERRIRGFNADYREAALEHPSAVRPVVRLYRPGEGPFAADATKIKQTRMVRS